MIAAKVLQVIVAFSLLNVWILRYSKPSGYRGKDSKNLKQEFEAYGLASWIHYVVGALKIGASILLLVGAWFTLPHVVIGSAAVILFLMCGAIAMHIKVQDPAMKSLPAFIVLVMSAGIIVTHLS